jgi:hypothetical protein
VGLLSVVFLAAGTVFLAAAVFLAAGAVFLVTAVFLAAGAVFLAADAELDLVVDGGINYSYWP